MEQVAIPFYELVVGFIVVSSLFELYLEFRQYRCDQSRQVPQRLKDEVKQETFEEAQRYQQARRAFGMVSGLYSLIETLLFLHFDVLPWAWNYSGSLLDQWNFSYFPNTEIPRSLVFMFLWSEFNLVTKLPFTLYDKFVLEEKFGFNKMTVSTFITDLVKKQLLTFIFGGPILAAIIAVVNFGGPSFYFYVWLLIFVISIVLMTIYPTVIAPLFNEFKPLEEGELRTAIYQLAERLHFPLSKLFVVDGSKRSAHSNAYFYGFFKNKRIVLFDTLLDQCDQDGILAILGHEMGHWKYSHTLKLMASGQAYTFLFLWSFSFLIHEHALYYAFGFQEPSVVIGLTLFSFVFSPLDHIFSFLTNVVSRRFEYQADEFACKLGLNMAPPLIQIHVKNLSNLVVDPWYSAFNNSHPTLLERLSNIQTVESKGK